MSNKLTKNKQQVVDFYEAIALDWDTRFKNNLSTAHFLNRRLNLLKQFMNLQGQETVLEIGCGTGFHLINLANYFYSGIGTDLAPAMLDIAKKNSQRLKIENVHFKIDDAETLAKFPNNSFGVVFFVGLLEHLINPLACFQNVWRVLKKGGRLVGITPNKYSPWYYLIGPIFRGKSLKHLSTDRNYSQREINQMLEQTHFTKIQIRHWGLLPANDIPNNLFKILAQIETIAEKTWLKHLAGGLSFIAYKHSTKSEIFINKN